MFQKRFFENLVFKNAFVKKCFREKTPNLKNATGYTQRTVNVGAVQQS